MKTFNIIKLACLATFTVMLCFPVFAQEENAESVQKKVVIIKKTIDENGEESIEKTIHLGKGEIEIIDLQEDGNMEIIEEDGKKRIMIKKEVNGDDKKEYFYHIDVDDSDEDTNVIIHKNKNSFTKKDGKSFNINIEEDGDQKTIKMKKVLPSGEERVFNWSGSGEIPEDVKAQMEEFNSGEHTLIFLDNDHDLHIHQDQNSNGNDACLGVVIKEEITNIDGTETVEGITDQGVVVQDILENTAASLAGLLEGDVITAIANNTIKRITELVDALNPFQPNDQVEISFIRDGQEQAVTATLKSCNTMSHFEVIEIDEEIEEDGNSQGNFESYILPNSTLVLNELQVFPNPTAGQLNVQFTAAPIATVVKLTTIDGKEVYKEKIKKFDGNYSKEISIKNTSYGTLILAIVQGEKIYNQKIIYTNK